MRPYLAVLKDSFREAFASRILWLLTGLITLILFLGLAPFTLSEESASRLQRNEFRSGPEFLKLLTAQETAKGPSPPRRIWTRLSDQLRDRLPTARPDNINEQVEVLNSVRGELNGMLNSDDLYDPTVWPSKSLTGEAQRLVERMDGGAELSWEERRRLNRLLIDAAFPDHILPAPGKTLYATWFGYRLGAPLPFEPKQLPILVQIALATLTTFLAGILGVFIAILVTAPIVPQTFEPGAIDLLLSKPVSRSVLFLTKFFGAISFILFNTIYLIGGMWLIAGLRFEIWSGPLLLCIPVFLFLFVIYYSVSALTGVIWRNAVVSVCCTILFWGLCFSVGFAKGLAEDTFLEPTRLLTLLPAGDKLLAVNRQGQTLEWSRKLNIWEEVFRGQDLGSVAFFFHTNRDNLVGPIYDPKADRLCAIEWAPTRFELFGGTGKLLVGPRNEDWRRIESAITPNAPQAIFVDPLGKILVVSLAGVYRFDGDPTREHRAFNMFGVDFGPRDRAGKFVRVYSSPGVRWQKPLTAAMNPTNGALAVVSRGKLYSLVPDAKGEYTLKKTVRLDAGKGESGKKEFVKFAGSKIAVALFDGRVQVFSGDTFAEQSSLSPPQPGLPREFVASPDGRWLAVLFDNHSLWLSDLSQHAAVSDEVAGQGDISAVAFSPANELFVADRLSRVTKYQLEPFERQKAFEPSTDLLQVLYHYVVVPLYTVFPKPDELNAFASHLVVGEPIELFGRDHPLRDAVNSVKKTPIDLRRPVWSNLAFLAVILTATCIYVSRRDF